MKIDNGECVHINRITVMPMPEIIVGNVHRLEKQHKYMKEGLELRKRKGKADAVAVDPDIINNSTGVSGDESSSDSDIDDESSADSDNDPSDHDFDDESMQELKDRGVDD